jgi:hypothetical protein
MYLLTLYMDKLLMRPIIEEKPLINVINKSNYEISITILNSHL